nr:reverse transcriptase domain-containing protein [Tanacetum cinerariifolium]
MLMVMLRYRKIRFTTFEPASISKQNKIPKINPHQPPILHPSRLNKDKLQDKFDIQIHKFLQMFKKLHFNISLLEALALMPKYAKILKDLLTNKEKLLEMANTPLNENCSAVILKKLPEKLRDPGKFLIPCDFKLANQPIAYPIGIAEDVFVQVGTFIFPADFVVVDYDVDPCVPLTLRRPFLRMTHALVDVHREELILRVGDEKLTFKEAFCFDVNHQEEKSSGSTTSQSDHSLPDYEALCFDIDHHEEKSSSSTISYFALSPIEYESFYFDLLTDPPPIVERSNSHHEEFADELVHIISPHDKVFDLGILLIDGVLSFTRKSPHLLNDNFKIDKRHIFGEISLKTGFFVSFHPMDKGIRGESS